jgi:hypothetical protein
MKMSIALAGFVVVCLTAHARGTTYYVGSGPRASDGNPGMSSSAPFATPQHAAGIANPGDTIVLMSGTYTNLSPDGAVIDITRTGTPNGWITFKAAPKQHPILRSTGWAQILIHGGASYIRIEGLDIYGHANDISLADAQKHAKDGGFTSTNSNGISIDGRQDGVKKPQHIEIVGNVVRNCPGGGVAVCQADYITITDNIVFDNAWWSPYETSGISIWQAWNADDASGYHNFIERNQTFGNRNYIPDINSGQITDGNGIILDDSKNTQAGSKEGVYRGRTLIANNLCYGNGGSGIHAFMSEHVDVFNNTCVDNNRTPENHGGQAFANSADDASFRNNILEGPFDKPINSNWNNGKVDWDYNIFWGGKPEVSGPHDLRVDSKVKVSRIGDRLVVSEDPRSPAVNAGTATLAVKDDLLKRRRPEGKRIDIGCLQIRSQGDGLGDMAPFH